MNPARSSAPTTATSPEPRTSPRPRATPRRRATPRPATNASKASKSDSPAAAKPLTARGAKTRASLVKAARVLFERQGYLDTNVGDIAHRARSAHGTFYIYFS